MLSRLFLCLPLALFGFAGLAHADLSCYISSPPEPAFGIPGQQTCVDNPVLSPGGQDSLPQFDPALGQLQSVVIGVDAGPVAGTAYFDYLGYDPSCNGVSDFLECADVGVQGSYSASISIKNLFTFSFGNTFYGDGTYCCAIGPASLSWSDQADYRSPGKTFTGAQVMPFIGTGSLEFVASGSASEDVYLGMGNATGATVDSISALFGVEYNFVTPEPSFFTVVALALACIVVRRFRLRRA